MKNTSKMASHVTRHTLVARATDLTATIAATEISLIQCDHNIKKDKPFRGLNDKRNVTKSVHCKPTVDRDTQVERHDAVGKNDSKRL